MSIHCPCPDCKGTAFNPCSNADRCQVCNELMQHCKCPPLEGEYHPDNPVFVSVGKREVKTETWHINPEYVKSVEQELQYTREQLAHWLWAYSLVTGILEGQPGWKEATETADFGKGQFVLEGSTLAKEARRALENQRAQRESCKPSTP